MATSASGKKVFNKGAIKFDPSSINRNAQKPSDAASGISMISKI
jgi:hypothetical protein